MRVRGLLFVARFVCVAGSLAMMSWRSEAAPAVSNLVVQQRAGTTLVDISYDSASAEPNLYVGVEVSFDGGINYDSSYTAFSGNGYGWGTVMPGVGKQIVWDAGAEWPGQYTRHARIRLSVKDFPFERVSREDEGMRMLKDLHFKVERFLKENGRLPGVMDSIPEDSRDIPGLVRMVSGAEQYSQFRLLDFVVSHDFSGYDPYRGKSQAQTEMGVGYDEYQGYWFATSNCQYRLIQPVLADGSFAYVVAVVADGGSPAPLGTAYAMFVRSWKDATAGNTVRLVKYYRDNDAEDSQAYRFLASGDSPSETAAHGKIEFPRYNYPDLAVDSIQVGVNGGNWQTYPATMAEARIEAEDNLNDMHMKIQSHLARYGRLPNVHPEVAGTISGLARIVSRGDAYSLFSSSTFLPLTTGMNGLGKSVAQNEMGVGYDDYYGLAFKPESYQYRLIQQVDAWGNYAYAVACVGSTNETYNARQGVAYAKFVRNWEEAPSGNTKFVVATYSDERAEDSQAYRFLARTEVAASGRIVTPSYNAPDAAIQSITVGLNGGAWQFEANPEP